MKILSSLCTWNIRTLNARRRTHREGMMDQQIYHNTQQLKPPERTSAVVLANATLTVIQRAEGALEPIDSYLQWYTRVQKHITICNLHCTMKN